MKKHTSLQVGHDKREITESQLRRAQVDLLAGMIDETSEKLIDAVLSEFILRRFK